MKRFGLFKWASASALPCALFILLVAAPVPAQNNNNSDRANTNSSRVADRDDNTDWGWLGLLGLAGLAGLIPKKRTNVVVQDRDVNTNRR